MSTDLAPLRALRSRYDAPDAAFDAALETLGRCARAWRVAFAPTLLGDPTCGLVVGGTARGMDVVLKVPVYAEEREEGYRAARAFDGHGGVSVLEGDDATGALLMERLAGPDLATLPETETTAVWCDLMLRLADAPAPTGADAVDRTEALRADALAAIDSVPEIPGFSTERHASIRARVVTMRTHPERARRLHADLHHGNVLHHRGVWWAIDPKGTVADPHHEVCAYLRNHYERLAEAGPIADLLNARIAGVARRTGLTPDGLRDWGIAWTYACAIWSADRPEDAWFRAMAKVTDALLEL